MEGKFSRRKRTEKTIFWQKVSFEQIVDLKPNAQDFRDFGNYFFDRKKDAEMTPLKPY